MDLRLTTRACKSGSGSLVARRVGLLLRMYVKMRRRIYSLPVLSMASPPARSARWKAEMRFRLQWQISVCISLILCWSNGAFSVSRQKQTPPRRHGPTDARELEQFLDKIFTEEMEKAHIPGAVFVFVKDGAVLFSKGYGFVDLERTKPVSADRTIFRIGSISKLFTAMAVVQLADRRKLDLQEDVNRYLKKIKVPTTYPQPITAAQLTKPYCWP